jgi:hypothetical protein
LDVSTALPIPKLASLLPEPKFLFVQAAFTTYEPAAKASKVTFKL